MNLNQWIVLIFLSMWRCHPALKTLLLSHVLHKVWFVGASCVTLLSSWGSKKLLLAATTKYKLQLQIDCLAMIMWRPMEIFFIWICEKFQYVNLDNSSSTWSTVGHCSVMWGVTLANSFVIVISYMSFAGYAFWKLSNRKLYSQGAVVGCETLAVMVSS